MEILLWIALAGVIVFLLGLLYSKFISSKASQPAANTIPPAKSSETVAAPAEKSVTAKTPPAPPSIKMVVPQEKSEAVTKQTVPVKQTSTAKKIIPAAEPVGPAHSKPAEAVPATEVSISTPVISEEPATPNISAASKSEPEPEKVTAPPPPTEPNLLKKPRNGTTDDLTLINGIGKAIQDKLFKIGIFHYDQLADLNEAQADWINRNIGFAGRMERENWGAFAKKLMGKAATTPSATPKRAVKKAVKPTAKTTTKAKPKTAKKTETT